MAEAIRVNFSRPMPLFPLFETVLLPHTVLPLHIFEPRYCQMVNDCLDQAGQIAMATYARGECEDAIGIDEKLRPVVCVGQIVKHETLSDDRHNILLHGVCRARIMDVNEACHERLYRTGNLSPLERPNGNKTSMPQVRTDLRRLLQRDRLRQMRSVETVLEWFDRDDIPTDALLELIGFTLIKDPEVKYRLLEQPDPRQRARMIRSDLVGLESLIRQAERQSHKAWPKGMSWN